ncbi:uncharacterized protein NPIL_142221 [Nephila pilipes]|uniref:Uncharacterized protein n=1 Tax=Nephila pilipes TaxID=299642 RepID=A0A8X6UQW7_NEPPI|nr:uncharacterized protein NPIL_142221 [Nephila pilipes]
MVDKLAKEGCNLPTPSTSAITYLELNSLKRISNFGGVQGASHSHWYAGNRPVLALALQCDRCSQTALYRLDSGHIKCLSFSANKTFSVCPRCQDHQASP